MQKTPITKFEDLKDRKPAYAIVGEVDLVVVRMDDDVAVFYGRCLHRGALMADGFISGNNLMSGCTTGITGWTVVCRNTPTKSNCPACCVEEYC